MTYAYDDAGQMTAIRENGAGLLAGFGYDDLGRRTSLTYGDGSVTRYGYDAVSRLGSQGLDLQGTANDLTLGFSYNPAAQIMGTTRSNDAYAYTGQANGAAAEVPDGLNRLTSLGTTALQYDGRGNVTSVGGQAYVYSTTGRLAAAAGTTYLYADSLERLDYLGDENLLLAHDGDAMVGELPYTGPDQRATIPKRNVVVE